jgi:hypothetical protein
LHGIVTLDGCGMLELCPSNEIRVLRPSSDSASLAASTRASSADVPRSTRAKGTTASTCSGELYARRRKQSAWPTMTKVDWFRR